MGGKKKKDVHDFLSCNERRRGSGAVRPPHPKERRSTETYRARTMRKRKEGKREGIAGIEKGKGGASDSSNASKGLTSMKPSRAKKGQEGKKRHGQARHTQRRPLAGHEPGRKRAPAARRDIRKERKKKASPALPAYKGKKRGVIPELHRRGILKEKGDASLTGSRFASWQLQCLTSHDDTHLNGETPYWPLGWAHTLLRFSKRSVAHLILVSLVQSGSKCLPCST